MRVAERIQWPSESFLWFPALCFFLSWNRLTLIIRDNILFQIHSFSSKRNAFLLISSFSRNRCQNRYDLVVRWNFKQRISRLSKSRSGHSQTYRLRWLVKRYVISVYFCWLYRPEGNSSFKRHPFKRHLLKTREKMLVEWKNVCTSWNILDGNMFDILLAELIYSIYVYFIVFVQKFWKRQMFPIFEWNHSPSSYQISRRND